MNRGYEIDPIASVKERSDSRDLVVSDNRKLARHEGTIARIIYSQSTKAANRFG